MKSREQGDEVRIDAWFSQLCNNTIAFRDGEAPFSRQPGWGTLCLDAAASLGRRARLQSRSDRQ
jgi:hypothetical protein